MILCFFKVLSRILILSLFVLNLKRVVLVVVLLLIVFVFSVLIVLIVLLSVCVLFKMLRLLFNVVFWIVKDDDRDLVIDCCILVK